MLNSYSDVDVSVVNKNTPSAKLIKSNPDSWFEVIYLYSDRGKKLFSKDGIKAYRSEKQMKVYPKDDWDCYYIDVRDPENDIIILQSVSVGENQMMVEVIYRKDFK